MNTFINQFKKGVFPLVILIIVLAIAPFTGIPQSWLLYLFLFFIYLSMANMWNLLAGYSGLLSLCQPAFIGLAGYALVVVTWSGLPFYLGIIAGAIVAAIVAVIIYIPVFRLRGIYFAIGTLVIPEILRIIFYRWRPVGEDLSGGGAGYIVKAIGDLSITHFYLFGLAVAVISVIIIRVILRSKLGLGLAAVRDNDKTAFFYNRRYGHRYSRSYLLSLSGIH
jgi:branched-chain amino acid transport system permease protein